MKVHLITAQVKIAACINSCNTPEQMRSVHRMLETFYSKYIKNICLVKFNTLGEYMNELQYNRYSTKIDLHDIRTHNAMIDLHDNYTAKFLAVEYHKALINKFKTVHSS